MIGFREWSRIRRLNKLIRVITNEDLKIIIRDGYGRKHGIVTDMVWQDENIIVMYFSDDPQSVGKEGG